MVILQDCREQKEIYIIPILLQYLTKFVGTNYKALQNKQYIFAAPFVDMQSENGTEALGISILAFLSVLGIIGNISVVIVILRRFRLESWTYILVCHLAFYDFLTCAIVGPLWIAAYIVKNITVCKSSIFVTCVLILCSSWTLVLIACERYIFIKYPLHYSLIITTKRFISSICALWIISVFVAVLTTTVALSTPATHQCLATLIVNRWVTMTFFAVFTLLPITFMLFAYTYILRAALRQQRKIEEFRSADERRAKIEKIRKELRTSLMLYAVVISYFVCTFPYSVVFFFFFFFIHSIKNLQYILLTTLLT